MGSTFPTWKLWNAQVITFLLSCLWTLLLSTWISQSDFQISACFLSGSFLVFPVQRNGWCMHFWPLSPLSLILWQLIWKVVLLPWNSLWWITSNNPTFNPKNWATCQVHLQSNFFNFHWWSSSNRVISPRSISAEMWFGFVVSRGISLSTCCAQDIPSFSNASAEHKAVTTCPRWMLLLPWFLNCMLDWSCRTSAHKQSYLE